MNVLIALPSQIADVITSPEMLFTTSYNDGAQDWHVYLSTQDTTQLVDDDTQQPLYPGAKLIGLWSADGSVATVNETPVTIDPDYLAYIRPIGNDAGLATDSLNFTYFAGSGQRHVQAVPVADTLPQYPADRQPYVVRVERTVITDDDWSHIPHGFKFIIEFADPSRDPGVRTFGVYSDAECTQYLWTVGGAFEEIEDEEGNITWQVECPIGQRTAEPQEWHFAMLFASLQEGHFTLDVNTQSTIKYFFNTNQGEDPPSGQGWVDSGQTVAAMYGTVTAVQDNSSFSLGDQVRIDGHESEVTGFWTGIGLTLTPYKSHAIGAIVEVWR